MDLATQRRRPRRIVARALVLSTFALLAAVLLAARPGAATGWNQGSAEATLWQLLNGARVNNGVAPLQQHGTLVSLARWRSSDMIQRNYFSHTILGTGCEVYCYYDSNGLNYSYGGENIGWNSGQTDAYSPIRVHEQFMGSPGHRANALNGAFSHGGVGAYGANDVEFLGSVQDPRMYTELFMDAIGSSPPAQPPAPPPGSGGGGGGGGGGGSAAPAAPAPRPTARLIAFDAPARPASHTGLDGEATVVVAGPEVASADAPSADTTDTTDAADAKVWHAAGAPKAVATGPMRVEAAPNSDSGFLDSILAAIFGSLGA